MYSKGDRARPVNDSQGKDPEAYRSPWRRDYARLIHSPSFRRLQGKTQVFPGNESDFYRNRLTHSLEVAQIAKSIAIRLNAVDPTFRARGMRIEPDIVEFAGLAHDLGHPPFGHNGEEALDECMRDHGGFEGNAQSLRIVSRLEKKATHPSSDGELFPFDSNHKDLRAGLNLTYRSLAALLKYDNAIPERNSDRTSPGAVTKGYYAEDAPLVGAIKKNVLGSDGYVGKFKTIECSIMDIADDIAYSTYDAEDIFKAGFLTPMGLFALDDEVYDAVARTIKARALAQYPEEMEQLRLEIDADIVRQILFSAFQEILFGIGDDITGLIRDRKLTWPQKKMFVAAEVQALSRKLANDGYHRIQFTSKMVQNWLNGIEVVEHPNYPQLNTVRLEIGTFLHVEVLKNITFHAIIRSPSLQVVEYRGKDIVKSIFSALKNEDGDRLLPDDFRAVCKGASETLRMRSICDFIAGMTDRYAFEFYGRLYGTTHLTVHKPF
ncbi:dNTP triphosphohydrolase [Bradyrhizobium ottawaense]|nr:dNTP triphosphohydrolase [Bradyrhizobium ottawaense]